MDSLGSIPFWDGLAIGACVVLYCLGVLLAELYTPVGEWLARRTGLADSGQSAPVYRCAIRLASRKRSQRMRALELLRDLNDPTSVPLLLRIIHRYDRDAEFVERAVRALTNLS